MKFQKPPLDLASLLQIWNRQFVIKPMLWPTCALSRIPCDGMEPTFRHRRPVNKMHLEIPKNNQKESARLNRNPEVAGGAADASCGSADIPVCGFTGLSSPVFPSGNWRLESRQNPQAGKPALRAERNSTSDFGLAMGIGDGAAMFRPFRAGNFHGRVTQGVARGLALPWAVMLRRFQRGNESAGCQLQTTGSFFRVVRVFRGSNPPIVNRKS